ncbi:hypothetical protein QM012_003473 [Aureobasidium pullulans]|uniref:Uncharacterized protein n=1 Tax=Aureobasidium pullulans TaxID=5580 RepID=A0ABR0T8I5_AURPU
MPPKAARVGADIIYRSETPLRQKRFPNRRRTVRSSGVHTPATLRQQSTLTQQPHWTVSRSSPSAGNEDEFEDEDDDYGEDELERSRPRRKKRKSEADGKRQTTMTQYVPSSFIGERYDGADGSLLQFVPDDWFDGVRDSQSQKAFDRHEDGPQAGTRATVSMTTDINAQMQRDEENQSQNTHSSSDHGDERVDSAFPKPQARLRPSPELPISAINLRTPRRNFKTEIPSSNTPQSALISICSAKTMRSPERSPLRNKSTNAFTQNHAGEDTRMSPVPESPTKPVSPFRLSPLKNRPTFRMPDKPPTLQHRSTIPDSEDTATQVTPSKHKKFRSQIPDTQMEMFGEEIAPVTETQFPIDSYSQYAGGTYYAENDDYDYNFDPVCSALDRDAARFMQTQLQRDRTSYDAFHKSRSFSQVDEEERAEQNLEQKLGESIQEPRLVTAQQSQELGGDLPAPTARPRPLEQEFEDAPTQSPRSSPQQPPRISYQSDEIEEIDLSGDIILPNTTIREVIQIASSPNNKSVSSGKYPSSPPLVVENDARLRAEAEEQMNNNERHSSPPLPIILPIPPSQISTVGGTQFYHSLRKHTQTAAYVSSSPPPMPPSTSSPPPEARQHLKRFLAMYESDDGDDMDKDEPEPPIYDEDEDDMDLDFVPQRQHDMDRLANSDNDDESDDEEGHSRLEDILPDTLLDFSLPPPPTQSTVRSTRS